MNLAKFCFIVALMGTILPVPAGAVLPSGEGEERAPFALAQNEISSLERQILEEMNRARTNPSAYANWLEQTKQYYQGNILQLPGQPPIVTQEGIRVVEEAIRFLRGLQPLPPLSLSLGMSRGVKDHVGDLGTKGAVGHYGSDGSQFVERMGRYGTASGAAGENITYGVTTAQAVVMQLVVDDGVEGRIHRDNIFYGGFRVTGVACGQHLRYEQMCAIAYSGDYVDRVAQTPPLIEPINPARISSSSNNPPVAVVETQPSPSVPTDPPVAVVETQPSPSVPALIPPPPASLRVGTPPPLPQTPPVPPPNPLTPQTPPPEPIQAETRRLSPPPAISPQTVTPVETTPPSLPPTNSSAAALIAPPPTQNVVGTTPTPTLPSSNNTPPPPTEPIVGTTPTPTFPSSNNTPPPPPTEQIVGTTPTPTFPSSNNNSPQPPAEPIVETTPTPTLPSSNNNAPQPPESSGEVAVGTPTIPPPQTAVKTILREQGLLEDGDSVYEQDGSLYDVHVFQGRAGQSVTITVESDDFDTFLALFDEKDDIVGQNDDINDEITNSALTITLPQDGTYRIFINGYDERDRGGYTLTVIE